MDGSHLGSPAGIHGERPAAAGPFIERHRATPDHLLTKLGIFESSIDSAPAGPSRLGSVCGRLPQRQIRNHLLIPPHLASRPPCDVPSSNSLAPSVRNSKNRAHISAATRRTKTHARFFRCTRSQIRCVLMTLRSSYDKKDHATTIIVVNRPNFTWETWPSLRGKVAPTNQSQLLMEPPDRV